MYVPSTVVDEVPTLGAASTVFERVRDLSARPCCHGGYARQDPNPEPLPLFR